MALGACCKHKVQTMKKFKMKPKVLLAIAVLLLSPITMNAQDNENRYGLQPWFGTSLLGRESGNVDGGDLNGQNFGETNGDITGQTFGVPLGSGLFVMLAAGIGYATIKTRKKQNRK